MNLRTSPLHVGKWRRNRYSVPSSQSILFFLVLQLLKYKIKHTRQRRKLRGCHNTDRHRWFLPSVQPAGGDCWLVHKRHPIPLSSATPLHFDGIFNVYWNPISTLCTVQRPAASSHTLHVREGMGNGNGCNYAHDDAPWDWQAAKPNVRWDDSNLRFQIQLYRRIFSPLLFLFNCKQN